MSDAGARDLLMALRNQQGDREGNQRHQHDDSQPPHVLPAATSTANASSRTAAVWLTGAEVAEVGAPPCRP